MIKNKESFLRKIASMPELRENKLSLIFALYPNIDISKRDRFVENLSPYFTSVKLEERENIETVDDLSGSTIDNWIGKDLRIKKFRIKSEK